MSQLSNPGEHLTFAPIFIGGTERSGTSLMRAILGSHSEVAFFPRDLPLWTGFFERVGNADLNRRGAARRLIEQILASPKFLLSGVVLDPDRIEERLARASHIDASVVFMTLLQEYAATTGRSRWGLKTPGNECFAGRIFAAHPDARVVQLIRDPRDVAISYKQSGWIRWRYDPDRHMALWRKSFRLSRKNQARFAGSYATVRYEDLVGAPEETIRSLCVFLKLPFEPEMLAMKGHAQWAGDNSSFEDVGRDASPISTRGVGRYRLAMSRCLLSLYQRRLGAELQQCQYFVHPVPSMSRWERMGCTLRRWLLRVRYTLGHAAAAILRRTRRTPT